MTPAETQTLIHSYEFKSLIKARLRLAVPIMTTIVTSYFGFILLVAFKPSVLGHTIGNSHISIGIYIGLGLLLLSFILTAIYIRLSDGAIATAQKAIHDKYK